MIKMEDSNHSSSNVSTSSSTIEAGSTKSSEDLASGYHTPVERKHITNLDCISSSSFSGSGSLSISSSVQDSFSGIPFKEETSPMTENQSIDLQSEDQSLDMGVFHTKRKLHGKDKKICRVCGDKALGYNFNAMTCESCKAFFRRNALKESTPPCMFQGNCNVDIRTRRFCPHCRLKKCFSMGMKKEMILDEARLRARRKKASNGQKPKAGELVYDPNRTSSLKMEDSNPEQIVTSYACSSFGDQTDSPTRDIRAGNFHDISWQIHTPESSDNNWPYQPWQTSKKDPDECSGQCRKLNDRESSCLIQLEAKFVSALETHLPGFPERLDDVKDFLNTSMIWAKKIVTYAKSVEDFKRLSTEAQIKCIKSSVRSALTLVGAYRFDAKYNAYFIQGKYVSVDNWMKAFSAHKDIAELFIRTCLSMQDAWYKDACLHAVFHLILLFNPDGDDLIQREFLSNLQNKYLILLKHYLESKYTYSKSKEYFAQLLKRSREMRTLSTVFTEVLVDTDPQKVDPLTKEVYSFETIVDKPPL